MPGELPLDDALAPFAEEVRFTVSGPPPVPSEALAEVLAAGFSGISPTEKGDLLATAARNVNGPAPQAARRPLRNDANWKKETDMPVTGVFAGLLAKLAGAGAAAKAGLAGVTAVTTMAMAGGAAGVLPGPAQTLVASAVNAATPFEFPGAGGATGAVERAVGDLPQLPAPVAVDDLSASPPVAATAGANAGSTSGSTSTSASAAANPPNTPAAVPALPGVAGVPALPQITVPPALVGGLPACVKDLIPTSGIADPARLATQIPGCITQVLGTASLPPEVAKCVSSILGTIGGANGMSTASVPSVGSLNVSSCVPMDSSKCVSSMLALMATMPGLSGGGGLPNAGSLPSLTNPSGCVPMNVTACLTALASAAGTGTTPKLDLSACMPTGLPTSGLPGAGSLPGMGSLPGISGALPFLGR